VSQSRVRAIPEGMHTIIPHIVVRDAARAAEWYIEALGAEERSRIPVPGDKLMSVELYVEDVDALWKRAVGAGAEVLHPLGDTFWGDRHGQITAPLVTAGGSPSTCATSRPKRFPAPQQRRSAVKPLTRSSV
jgi:PhnB protein